MIIPRGCCSIGYFSGKLAQLMGRGNNLKSEIDKCHGVSSREVFVNMRLGECHRNRSMIKPTFVSSNGLVSSDGASEATFINIYKWITWIRRNWLYDPNKWKHYKRIPFFKVCPMYIFRLYHYVRTAPGPMPNCYWIMTGATVACSIHWQQWPTVGSCNMRNPSHSHIKFKSCEVFPV